MKAKLILLILLLLMPSAAFAQKRKAVKTATKNTVQTSVKYYLDIVRPGCCQLRLEKWQDIAQILRAKNIAAFFGTYEITDFRQEWHPVKLTRTVDDQGLLILGPFASTASAEKVLKRLPAVLPKMQDDFSGVQAGPTGDNQTWQIGMYQITGFRTSEPAAVEKPRVKKSGVIEGIVVENTGGVNWIGVIVESGGIRYNIQLGGNYGAVEMQSGDVATIGNRVRIIYKDSRLDSDGTYFLNVKSIVEIKKK